MEHGWGASKTAYKNRGVGGKLLIYIEKREVVFQTEVSFVRFIMHRDTITFSVILGGGGRVGV